MNPILYIASQVHKFPILTTWLIIALFVFYILLLVLHTRYRQASFQDTGNEKREVRQREEQSRALLGGKLEKLKSALYGYGTPSFYDGRLFFGDYEVDGRNELVDQVVTGSGQYATVFKGDIRASTNVRRADGSRAIGTRLARGPAYVSAFENGKTFYGEAILLGHPILAIYDPIKIKSAVVGIIFVGMRV